MSPIREPLLKKALAQALGMEKQKESTMKPIVCLVLAGWVASCSAIGPVFVDYNGVRRDVATWINGQTLLSMQQKRSLAQLARAEQPLLRDLAQMDAPTKLALAKQRQTALACAHNHVSDNKINQLQQQVFGTEQARILTRYEQEFPRIKLDVAHMQCD